MAGTTANDRLRRMGPAKPQHAPSRDDAPNSLAVDDEWSEVIAEADYVGESAEGVVWSDVIVRGGRWSGATIEGFQATDVRFENCDLAGFVLQEDVSLRRVEFVGCRMTGAVLAGAHLRDVSFESCVLDDANLRMVDAIDVAFADCSLLAVDLHAAKLAKVALTRCDLRAVDITKAILTDVDLRTSRLEDIVGATALRGATIDSVQALSVARSLALALGVTVLDNDPQ